MYRMSDHSNQIEESHFSQELHYASLRNCIKESIQWVSLIIIPEGTEAGILPFQYQVILENTNMYSCFLK